MKTNLPLKYSAGTHFDMITAHAEINGCMCRHDHCIRRSLHVHAMSVYSQDTPMYMQTLLLKHTARHGLRSILSLYHILLIVPVPEEARGRADSGGRTWCHMRH